MLLGVEGLYMQHSLHIKNACRESAVVVAESSLELWGVLYLENNNPKFHSKRCKGTIKPDLDLWKNADDAI